MTEPRGSIELLASSRPAKTVYLDSSEAKIPVERTVKAKTDATTTKAIRMSAVSRPVIPFSCFGAPKFFVNIKKSPSFRPQGRRSRWSSSMLLPVASSDHALHVGRHSAVIKAMP